MENMTGHSLKGYDLLERIGSGGFGAVYRAYQSTIGREVAVKVILPHFADRPAFIRRFEAEAQLIARLEHLHIVPLYDYWREPGGAYLVMRWLRGGSAKDALRDGPFGLAPAAQLLDQVAAALTVAHTAGVVHRDLKPSNILLDEEGNAYLADFGIAADVRRARGDGQEGETALGSPAYLAPEQARGEPPTPQTDIYSLGVTLYELLAAGHPFAGVNTVELLYRQLNEPLPPLTTLAGEVQADVNAVIQRATAKDPRQRYDDALALALAFRKATRLKEAEAAELAELLTQREEDVLRLIAAGLTNRQIAEKLFVEHTTVKWYIRQIYRKLDVRSRRQAIARAREMQLGKTEPAGAETDTTSTSVALPPLVNPYKGLRAFTAADRGEFFGREALIDRLLERLALPGSSGDAPGAGHFLAVIGPSGSGKSSLVRAGLVPALWEGGLPGSEQWFVAELTPGARPLDELEVALMRVAADQAGNLHELLARDAHGLLRSAQLILPRDGSELVLVIDQFEELFSLVEKEEERAFFLKLLATAVADPRSRVRVVLTLRADYYDRPLHYQAFGQLVRRHMETLLPLTAEELERAIVQPAAALGVAYEPGLAATIVNDVLYQPGALPLLQYALTELFEQRQGRLLTHEAYAAIGGATGALARRAEELYMEQDGAGRALIRQLFLRLVSVNLDDDVLPDTRRRVPLAELLALGADEDLVDDVIDLFAAYRLLTLDHDPASRRPTVEVAHEALLREWQRLRAWLKEGREAIRLQRRLANAAAEWRAAGCEAGYLLRGARLRQFESWAAGSDLALTPDERAYLQASLAARDERKAAAAAQQAREEALEARSRRRLRYLAAVLAAAAVIAGILSLLAVNYARQAGEQARVATSRELAAAAMSNLSVDPERSVLLALAGLEAAYTVEAENALHRALPEMHLLQTIAGHDHAHDHAVETLAISPDGRRFASADVGGTVIVWNSATGEELLRFSAGSEIIFGMVFSPDGGQLVTASADGTARFWDSVTGEGLITMDHGAPLSDVAVSPDGARLVTAGADAVARVWDGASGEQLLALEGHAPAERVGSLHPGGVVSAAFTPDGRQIVTGGADGTVRLWDAADGQALHVLSRHTNEVYLAPGPDGNRLVTAGYDGQVLIWDIAPGAERSEPTVTINQEQPARAAAFSPDGRLVAVAGQDGAARVWDAVSGQRLLTLVGHAGLVDDLAFTPDGSRLVTVAEDKTVKVWDLAPGRERLTLIDGRPIDVVYSPDGARLATAQADGTIAIRDSATGQTLLTLSGHPDQPPGGALYLSYSPDGALLASSSWDMTAKVWDVATGEELYTLTGHSGFVWYATFSPDGTRLATAGHDGKLKIWETATGRELLSLSGHTRQVGGVAYSPDGSRLVSTGNCDNTARLWDAATGRPLAVLDGEDCLWGVAFSPDGRRLATGRADGSAVLWDIAAAEPHVLTSMAGHTAFILSVAFSPDGERLATASFDRTARVWDLATGQEWLTFSAPSEITRVAFSPDGTELATASRDGQVRIWVLDLDELVALARSRLTRDLTAEECEKFLHTEACPPAP